MTQRSEAAAGGQGKVVPDSDFRTLKNGSSGLAVNPAPSQSSDHQTLRARLDWLCNLPLGTTWTEWHWREALSIREQSKCGYCGLVDCKGACAEIGL